MASPPAANMRRAVLCAHRETRGGSVASFCAARSAPRADGWPKLYASAC